MDTSSRSKVIHRDEKDSGTVFPARGGSYKIYNIFLEVDVCHLTQNEKSITRKSMIWFRCFILTCQVILLPIVCQHFCALIVYRKLLFFDSFF